jgi:hypothetical protein
MPHFSNPIKSQWSKLIDTGLCNCYQPIPSTFDTISLQPFHLWENNNISDQNFHDAATTKFVINLISSLENFSSLQVYHNSFSNLSKFSSSATPDLMNFGTQEDSQSHSTAAWDITFYFKQYSMDHDTPFFTLKRKTIGIYICICDPFSSSAAIVESIQNRLENSLHLQNSI